MTDLPNLPPSCKLVYKALEYEGPLTQPELADETALPKRTVRYALDRLQEADELHSEPVLDDARQKRYSLPDSGK